MKRLPVVAIAAVFTLLPTWAQAFCQQTGHIDRVTVTPTSATIILRNTPITENLRWVATTIDSKIANAMVAALTSRTRVAITAGTLSSGCPSAGVERTMGPVFAISLAP